MQIEPERYELFEDPPYVFTLSRREFLGAAGFLVCVSAAPAGWAQDARPEARLHVADDGVVTVFTGKVEVGQGSRTEIAMAAAEELEIPLDRVRVVMADTGLVPNDGITAGSRTTPSTIPLVRKAAAAARKVMPDSLHPAGRWRVLGKSHHQLAAREIVTGAHRFPSDIVRPGMLFGSVLRPPAYGARLQSVNLEEAQKIAGVVAVHDGAFAGCAATTSLAARRGVDALAANARWEVSGHPSSEKLFEYLKSNVSKQRQPRVQTKGNVEEALPASARRLRGVYQVPYIQHAPMEPRAAVAEWNDGRLSVWTGTQNPFGVRDQLMQAFRLSADRVRVVVPDTGGGFGGKHSGEAAIEAARLAHAAGRAVSLRWTRTEEFTWAYFRPAGLFEIEAGLDSSGHIAAWDFANYNAGTAAIESPYDTSATRTRFYYCDSPLREGSYRGIAATANNFARECFIDELAGLAALDPLEFRLNNLRQDRLRQVLLDATGRFRWKERRRKGNWRTGVGLACGTEKGSFVAACAEVEATTGGVGFRVREICMAFECGTILNPANLQAQVEGSIIQGLGGALTEQVAFQNGKLTNGSFSRYRTPRFRDVPRIDILLAARRDVPPAGAGETPIIVVAPAIANAVFDASGKRTRALPISISA